MKKILKAIGNWYVELFRAWRREFRLVFSDMGVMLFFFALPTLYPVVYALIYNPELIKNVDVVVVDNCRTASSRHLVRTLDATEPIGIRGYAANMSEARDAMNRKDCYGILEIPADYDNKLGNGEQATVTFYTDMSLLLRFRQFTTALTDVQLATATNVATRKLDDAGLVGQNLKPMTQPVGTDQMFVGDPTQGFASFIMPGILVLILQQSIVLGASMLAGNSAERRRRNRGYDPLWVNVNPMAATLGKALCLVCIYLPLLIYTLHVVPWMFKLPHYGNMFDELLLMVPFLLASSMFGQTVGVFVTERESSFLVVVFTSVVFLFLSGLTWPRYAMSPFWQLVGDCVPATWGLEGFVRINSDNANLFQQSRPYHMLWILAGVYFVTASLVAWGYNRQNSRSASRAVTPSRD